MRIGIGLLMGVLAVGCGDSSPIQPTANPSPGDSAGPTARLVVTIDSLSSREAVTALSNVTVDASGSSGTSLTYRTDFGDGTTGTQPVARHVYGAPGTYTATITVTDALGRTASISQPVVVASLLGTWTYSGYVPRARYVEVRTLALTTQDGRTVRGVLRATGGGDRTIVGTLSGERDVRLVLDDQSETLEGVIPGVVTGESGSWDLLARGGSVDGEHLGFVPLRGEPSGSPPDAVLKMRFFSFSAPFAVQGYSPILFDGSTSRGEGLTYFIEFGDREFSTEPMTVHPIATAGTYTARLTVVDRFGRSDQEAARFDVRSLVTSGSYEYWYAYAESQNFRLLFDTQDGQEVVGRLWTFTSSGQILTRFRGTLSGEGDIRLVFEASNTVLGGTLNMRGYFDHWRMVLTQTGGSNDGQTYTFRYNDNY
jgi:PKD repeat protein